MQKTCTYCSAIFTVPEDELRFQKDMDVPPPNQCAHCRFVRRLNERNARNLYKRKCDLTGREFISPYSDVPFPVYHPDEWITDKWDELSYGREIDWKKPFFEQLLVLFHTVPRQGQFICPGTLQNSEYVNCAGYLKDCYLLAETDYNERCMYGNRVYHNHSVVDCSNIYESELCYECVDCTKCHSSRYCIDSENCSNSYFLRNCIGCTDCIGCMNLRHKSNMIFNEQLTPEEYEKEKQALKLHTYEGVETIRQQSREFFLTQPHRYVQMEQVQNCSGDHLFSSKNAIECIDCKDLEDCKYCARVFSVKTALDYTSWGDQSERIYFTSSSGDHAYNLRFCTTCTTNVTHLTYCGHSTGSSDCFGCVGVRKKKYCILNKEYTKEEYEELVPKLIEYMKKTPLRSFAGSYEGQAGEWGEFFPREFCSFGYNETIAQEYFPLTKNEALRKGYPWKDQVRETPSVKRVIPAAELPSTCSEVTDSILDWAVLCEVSGRPFKIIKQELEFYRQLDIPLPHLHPDERHNRRMALRPSRVFYDRSCSQCGTAIHTTFAPEKPEIVYCETCYQETVY